MNRYFKFLVVAAIALPMIFTSCKKEEPTFTVTFDSQGGSSVAQLTNIASGSKITKPADPTKPGGVTFVGWYKESACENVWDFNTDVVKQNITLYAKWAVIVTGQISNATSLPDCDEVYAILQQVTVPKVIAKAPFANASFSIELPTTLQASDLSLLSDVINSPLISIGFNINLGSIITLSDNTAKGAAVIFQLMKNGQPADSQNALIFPMEMSGSSITNLSSRACLYTYTDKDVNVSGSTEITRTINFSGVQLPVTVYYTVDMKMKAGWNIVSVVQSPPSLGIGKVTIDMRQTVITKDQMPQWMYISPEIIAQFASILSLLN